MSAIVDAGGVVGSPSASGRHGSHLQVAPCGQSRHYRRPGHPRIDGAPHVPGKVAPLPSSRQDDVRRIRVHNEGADGRVPEVGSAVVGPGGAAVGRLHDAHAVAAGAIEVARTDVHCVRVAGVQRDAVGLKVGPAVAQGPPVGSAVRALPDAAAGRRKIVGARMPGVVGHCVDAAAQLALAVEEAVGRCEVPRSHELPPLTQTHGPDAVPVGADVGCGHLATVRRRCIPPLPVHAVVGECAHPELVQVGLQIAACILPAHLAQPLDGPRHFTN